MRIFPTLIAAMLVTGATMDAAIAAGPVPYPVGYREWVHVSSMVIEPGHPLFDSFGGLHHLYANAKAMEGYRSGIFPEGSVIVFDLDLERPKSFAEDGTFANSIRAADRVVFMADGAIVEEAAPEEFFSHPKSDRAKDFLSKILA